MLWFKNQYRGIKQTKDQKQGSKPIFLLFEDLFPAKWKVGRSEVAKIGKKGGNTIAPLQVDIPKFFAEELLFGKHDALVVHPIEKAEG